MVNAFTAKIAPTPTPTPTYVYRANVINTSNDVILYPTDIPVYPTSITGTVDDSSGVAITPDGLYAIIVNQGQAGSSSGSAITVINAVTNQVVQSASGSLNFLGGRGFFVATGTVGGSQYAYISYAYESGGANDVVLRLDFTNGPPNTSSATQINLGAPELFPGGIAVTPNGNYVYVLNNDNVAPYHGSVSIIRTSDNHVPYPPYKFSGTTYNNAAVSVAITPDNATAYVVLSENTANGQVAFFAVGSTVSATPTYVTVGTWPTGIAITPNVTGPQTVFVSNYGDDSVSYFHTGASPSPALVSDPSHTFHGPGGLSITPDGTKLYVCNNANDTVSVVDLTVSPPAVSKVISTPGGGALGIFIQQNLNQDTTFAQGVTSSWFGT